MKIAKFPVVAVSGVVLLAAGFASFLGISDFARKGKDQQAVQSPEQVKLSVPELQIGITDSDFKRFASDNKKPRENRKPGAGATPKHVRKKAPSASYESERISKSSVDRSYFVNSLKYVQLKTQQVKQRLD